MEGESNVEVSLTLATGEFSSSSPAATTAAETNSHPHLRETINQVRYHASWIDSFAATLESTVAAAVEARCNELQLSEENKVNERLKELEKLLEAANRKSIELEAKEDTFKLLVKKEIEHVESEKAILEKKMQEFESLGNYLEERLIRVREVEEEIELRRKEVESKEKEIEECFAQFQLREKGFEEQLAEFQVRLIEFEVRENQFKELESKLEEQFKFLAKQIQDVEIREKQVESEANKLRDPLDSSLCSLDHSSEASIRICVKMNGKDLQIFLNERSNDNDSAKSEIEAALKLSSEPAKLVLDAMEGFYPPHLKKEGVEFEFESGIVRNSCLMLLEQLTRMSPEIKPTVRKEAMKVACDWMSRMNCDADHSLEVLALLQLMAAYGLASTFEEDELVARLGVVAHYSQARSLLQELGLANKISGVIQKLIEKNRQDEAYRLVSAFELHNEFPSLKETQKLDVVLDSGGNRNDCTDPDHAPATSANLPDQNPESLPSDQEKARPCSSAFVPECLENGSTALKTLSWKIENDKLHCPEIAARLRLASDPAEFVLTVVKDPSSFKWSHDHDEQVRFASPEHAPLLLLDRMWRMAPRITQTTETEALSFALEWKSKLLLDADNQMNDNNIELVSFMLFIAAYRLDSSSFDLHDLFSLFRTSYWCLNVTKLFRALRCEDLVSKFIKYLMRNRRPRQALQCINSSSLLEKSPSVKRLLSGYLFKRSKKLSKPTIEEDSIGDMNKELHIWRALVKPVADQTLVECFKARISFLEKRKEETIRAETNREAIATAPPKSPNEPKNDITVAATVPSTNATTKSTSSTDPQHHENRAEKRRKLSPSMNEDRNVTRSAPFRDSQ
ncbi:FRIGIDA-like protein 3 [Linum perenne]